MAMSFLGGAECSTASNPLSQFTKHVQDDHSLQRDRLVGQGPQGLQESFRSLRVSEGIDEVRWLGVIAQLRILTRLVWSGFAKGLGGTTTPAKWS